MNFAVLPEPAFADRGTADQAESSVQYLQRSTRAFAAASRRLLNQWGSELDATTAAGVLSRLRANDDGQFRGAFFEMYLEQTFRTAGWLFDREPAMTSSSGRPDFVIRDPDIIVEATSTNPNAQQGRNSGERIHAPAGPSGERTASFDTAEERRMHLLVDRMNTSITSGTFTLSGEAWDVGPGLPPARKLERPLAAWLATLDPDEVDPAHPLPWTFSELGWRIEFLAFPIPVEHRGTLGRTVEPFMSAIGTTVVDHWVLRSRLEEKSPNKYGVSGRPYVVAVDEDSWQHSDAELHRAEALFGDRSIRYSAGNVQWGTAANGFWYPTRRTACSAVLLVGHLKPWNALNQTPELWLNPWADTPMPATLPHWRIRRLALDEQRHHHVEVTEPTMTPREFWGDSYGWWFDVNAAN